MHIFWTHIFKSRDVYLLIKRWSIPTESVRGWAGWRGGRCKSVKKVLFKTSVKLLHSRPAAKHLDSSCLWEKFGSVAKQKEEETAPPREKRKAFPPAPTQSFRSSFWCLNEGKSKCWRVLLRLVWDWNYDPKYNKWLTESYSRQRKEASPFHTKLQTLNTETPALNSCIIDGYCF